MNINDNDWREAQEILRNSIKPSKGKQYLRFFSRPSHQYPFKQILLDTSDCWPREVALDFVRPQDCEVAK